MELAEGHTLRFYFCAKLKVPHPALFIKERMLPELPCLASLKKSCLHLQLSYRYILHIRAQCGSQVKSPAGRGNWIGRSSPNGSGNSSRKLFFFNRFFAQDWCRVFCMLLLAG